MAEGSPAPASELPPKKTPTRHGNTGRQAPTSYCMQHRLPRHCREEISAEPVSATALAVHHLEDPGLATCSERHIVDHRDGAEATVHDDVHGDALHAHHAPLQHEEHDRQETDVEDGRAELRARAEGGGGGGGDKKEGGEGGEERRGEDERTRG